MGFAVASFQSEPGPTFTDVNQIFRFVPKVIFETSSTCESQVAGRGFFAIMVDCIALLSGDFDAERFVDRVVQSR